jgi:hypothetical protein
VFLALRALKIGALSKTISINDAEWVQRSLSAYQLCIPRLRDQNKKGQRPVVQSAFLLTW